MRKLLLTLLCLCAFATPVFAAPPPMDISPDHFTKLVSTNKQQHKLIFIFASWCKICKKEFPDLLSLHKKYKAQGVEFIAISLDEEPQKLKNYVYKQHLEDLPIYRFKYSDVSELSTSFKKLGINYRGGIPHITLLKQNNEVVADGNYLLSSFDTGLELLISEK